MKMIGPSIGDQWLILEVDRIIERESRETKGIRMEIKEENGIESDEIWMKQ